MEESKKKRILLVEDDKTLAEMYQNKFVLDGFQINVSQNGVDGFEAAIRLKPDLILLDILLPHMNGIEVMKKLRNDIWGKKVPIILLTNLNPDDEILREVIEGHPSYYLMKSNTDPQGVVEKVKEILS